MTSRSNHRRAIAVLVGLIVPFLSSTAAALPWIITQPLSIRFPSTSGEHLPALSAEGESAFYVLSGGTRIRLADEPIESTEGTSARLVYEASDGRTAVVTISDGPEGTIRVVFTADPKGEFEKLGAQFQVDEAEGFYGLMERVVQGSQGFSWEPGMTEGLNLRGQTVDLYTLPTASIYAPFFLSSAGYGIFVEGDWPSTYRFGVDGRGKTRPSEVTIESEGPTLSFLLLPGPNPIDVIERYARWTGMPLFPPHFMFGPGRWRDIVWDFPEFYDGTPYDGPYNSMIVEDVLMMEALGIPCTWYVVDRPWAAGTFGYGDMRLDARRLPEFEAMVSWLRSRGIAILLWLGPWGMDGQRDTAIGRGYHVLVTIPYLPNAALIDFTDPAARTWWQAELEPLFETGISGFKLDRGEEKPPDGQVFRGAYADGTPYREGHNTYPLWFARAAHEAAQAAGRDEFVLFYRAGWIGSSQLTVSWGGDTDPSAWGLRSAIIALQRAAILNTPIWGSDTGGYNTRPPRDVLARWLAFSAFCPIMEVGPTANLAPWSWLPDGSEETLDETGYRFETVYDEELLAIWSFYARVHVELAEYVSGLAERASTDGTPIVRPMIVAYPERSEYVDLWSQYLYGPDLLVRPVWEPGIGSVEVHIPEGTWIDAWTGTRHTGPTVIAVDVPLHVVPLFLRDGGSVDLTDLSVRWEDALKRVAEQPHLAELAHDVH